MPTASARTLEDRRKLTLELDESTFALAAEALRGEADRRRRAGLAVSAELIEAKRNDGADIRTGALRVVEVLAEADNLAAVAAQLSEAWEAGKPPTRRRRPSPVASVDVSPGDPDDANDELDLENDEDVEAATGPDGATVVAHDDDPDVAAARAALASVPPPAEAAAP